MRSLCRVTGLKRPALGAPHWAEERSLAANRMGRVEPSDGVSVGGCIQYVLERYLNSMLDPGLSASAALHAGAQLGPSLAVRFSARARQMASLAVSRVPPPDQQRQAQADLLIGGQVW